MPSTFGRAVACSEPPRTPLGRVLVASCGAENAQLRASNLFMPPNVPPRIPQPMKPTGATRVGGTAVTSVVAILFAILAGAATAPAQPAQLPPYHRWLAPPPEQQLAADPTELPEGMGAIFVPTLSDGESEPESSVLRGSRQVASGPNGTRIPVPPGAYSVGVGSGSIPERVIVPVEVTMGETTVVPVRWGGLRVEVVDERSIPHGGSFELIRVVDRQVHVTGSGADPLEGERLRTLLLPEDLYRIVRRRSAYRTTTDFASVFVPAGALVHYRLVLSRATGLLRGGAAVTAEEIGQTGARSPWTRRFSAGLSVPFASTVNVVGKSNQTTVAADVFLDAYLTYQRNRDFLGGILEIEQGVLVVDPEGTQALPVQKTSDRIRADLFFSRFLGPDFGPYLRVGLLTNARVSNTLFTRATGVTIERLDGTLDQRQLGANRTLRTGGAFSPVLLREGLGLNARLVRLPTLTLDWRGGVGLRQNWFREALYLDDDPQTEALDYRQAASFKEVGAEMTILVSGRYRLLTLNSSLDLFGNIGKERHLTVDWRSTVTWQLTSGLSLNYNFDLARMPQVRSENQVTQALLLGVTFGA